MIKKLKNHINSLIKSPSLNEEKKKDEIKLKSTNTLVDLELEIDLEDINSGLPSSERNSIIANCFRRNGMEGTSTPCKMVLDNGEIYIPEQLSDHWKFFIGSPKVKPMKIKYILVE
jgi:hypothetical protein